MTDAELDLAIEAARKRAHEAPFGEYNLHADGTAEIRNHTYAWAKESAEWVRLCDERDHRRAVSGTGDPADLTASHLGEGEPASDPGLTAGSPVRVEYVLVPAEPTIEMIRASKGALYRYIVSLPEAERNKYGKLGYRVPQRLKVRLRWRAMLEAAALHIHKHSGGLDK